jgi:pyrroline-5-carboxylate reductase
LHGGVVMFCISVRELVGIPDITVVKSVPLPPVALHAGVSVLYPRHPEMVALFEVLGKVICVETEDHLRVLQAGSGMMGPFYKTVLTMQEWMKAQGIADADAAVFAGGFYQCVSADSAEQTSGEGLAHLIAEQTPGGLNEEAIRRHSEAGCYDGERAALDATLARLTKAAL